MHRIDSPTASPDENGAGQDGFTAGDPTNGVPPTDLTADWFNDAQEELCNLIEAMGIALIKGDQTQLLQALRNPMGEGANPAINAIGGLSGSPPAMQGTGGGPNGAGYRGIGTGTGQGVLGEGDTPVSATPTAGAGVAGRGGSTNGPGTEGFGCGTGPGARGVGAPASPGSGTAGAGGNVTGGSATTGVGGHGLVATGGATSNVAGTPGRGVDATGGAGSGGTAGGIGVRGTGGGTASTGVEGVATAGGAGVRGDGTAGAYGVVANGDTTSPTHASLRVVPQNAEPSSSPASGDVIVHTTTGKMRAHDGTKWNRVLSNDGRIVATEQLAGTAETAFTGVSIPAGTLVAGSTIRVHASGIGMNDGAGTGTFTLRLRIGGVAGTLMFQATALTRDSSADKHWTLDACYTVFETGASATIVGHGVLHYGVVDAAPVTRITGVDDFGVNAKTIDTTGALSVVVTHDNVMGTGDTILDQLVVDVS